MKKKASPADIFVSITVLNQLFAYLKSLNVNIDSFLESIGVLSSEVRSPDGQISIEIYLLIQDSAAEHINDPLLGLHMGEYAEAGSWSILGYLMANCRTLGEAFEKSGRYHRIIGNLIEGRGKIKFNKIQLELYTPPHAPAMSPICFESTLSSSVCMVRRLSGQDLNPIEVTFSHAPQGPMEEYERVFGCPVKFNQKSNTISMHPSLLNTPVRYANPQLRDQFEQYAQKFISEIENNNPYSQEVTRIILSRLDDENISIKSVAKEMNVSVRTLQKWLKAEGTVFSDLLTDIRKRLARKYIQEDYSIAEITYLLGYSEPSVFRKAFKKWQGITPKEFRESAVHS